MSGYGDDSPQVLMGDMREIEDEIVAELKNQWAKAEDDFVMASAAVAQLEARQWITFKQQPPTGWPGKPTKEDLQALVRDWLWTEQEDAMRAQLLAEAAVAAFKTQYKCAETALSSKQTRLNAEVKMELGVRSQSHRPVSAEEASRWER